MGAIHTHTVPQGDDEPQGPSTTEKFEAFHRDNPHFYDLLVRLARRYLQRTESDKVGIQRLIEVARWNLEIKTKGDEFKVNNDFGCFYSRLIAFQEPDLVDAFTKRKSREADAWIESKYGPEPHAA